MPLHFKAQPTSHELVCLLLLLLVASLCRCFYCPANLWIYQPWLIDSLVSLQLALARTVYASANLWASWARRQPWAYIDWSSAVPCWPRPTSGGTRNTRDASSSPYGRDVSVWLPRRKCDLPPPSSPCFMPELSYLTLVCLSLYFSLPPSLSLRFARSAICSGRPQPNCARGSRHAYALQNTTAEAAAARPARYLSRGWGQPLWSPWQRLKNSRGCEEEARVSSRSVQDDIPPRDGTTMKHKLPLKTFSLDYKLT